MAGIYFILEETRPRVEKKRPWYWNYIYIYIYVIISYLYFDLLYLLSLVDLRYTEKIYGRLSWSTSCLRQKLPSVLNIHSAGNAAKVKLEDFLQCFNIFARNTAWRTITGSFIIVRFARSRIFFRVTTNYCEIM